MSNAVKLKNNHMIDAEGVHDANQGISQKDINSSLLKKKIQHQDYTVNITKWGMEYALPLSASKYCVIDVVAIHETNTGYYFTTFAYTRFGTWYVKFGDGTHNVSGGTCNYTVTLRVFYYEASENAYEEARYTSEKTLIEHLLPTGLMYTGTCYFTTPELTTVKCASYKWIPNTVPNYIHKYGTLILYEGLLSNQAVYTITYTNGTYKTTKLTFTSTATYTT